MPVPKSIVPRTYAKVENPITYKIGRNVKLTIEEIRQMVQTMLNNVLNEVIFETAMWSEEHFPVRSGDLLNSFLDFLQKSRPPPIAANELRGIRLVLGIGVDIDYAEKADKMPIGWLRHMGTWYEHSGAKAYSKGKPVYLNDPRADSGFFEKATTFAKESLMKNLAKGKYQIASGNKMTSLTITGIHTEITR